MNTQKRKRALFMKTKRVYKHHRSKTTQYVALENLRRSATTVKAALRLRDKLKAYGKGICDGCEV
eukprot:6203804-Pleurochrysis_carterae.AAC.3